MNDDPARWDRVKQVFQAVLDRPAEERARFLSETCGDDHALRREVESLLVAHQQAGDFAERPAFDALVGGSATATSDPTMTPSACSNQIVRLGPCRVIERIGRGGMGEV